MMNGMTIKGAVACVGLTLLLSCKGEKSAVPTEESIITQDVPSDFLDFYFKFHSDSLYQISHIVFPLKQMQNGESWQKEEWKIHKPYDDHGGQYQRQFVNLSGIIIEKISDGSGIYSMERRFIKSNDGYDMIFYQVINALNNSPEWEKEGE